MDDENKHPNDIKMKHKHLGIALSLRVKKNHKQQNNTFFNTSNNKVKKDLTTKVSSLVPYFSMTAGIYMGSQKLN